MEEVNEWVVNPSQQDKLIWNALNQPTPEILSNTMRETKRITVKFNYVIVLL